MSVYVACRGDNGGGAEILIRQGEPSSHPSIGLGAHEWMLKTARQRDRKRERNRKIEREREGKTEKEGEWG